MIVGGLSKHFLYDAIQSLGDEEVYLALLGPDADVNPFSSTFSGAGEIRAQGYAAGGKRLSGFKCGLDDGVAWGAWSNVEWQNASIRAHGAVVYVKSRGNRVLTVLDFGGEERSSQGLFRVKMPAPGVANAIVWLA